MALKPCRECKKKVSTEAVSCPNCGVPNPTLTLKIKPNYGFVRCEKSFCKNSHSHPYETSKCNAYCQCSTSNCAL